MCIFYSIFHTIPEKTGGSWDPILEIPNTGEINFIQMKDIYAFIDTQQSFCATLLVSMVLQLSVTLVNIDGIYIYIFFLEDAIYVCNRQLNN